jgi:transcriptional regulator with XRE-family HTH domain
MKKIAVGYKIKSLRMDKGLSQAALAKKAGISPVTMSRIETNLNQPKVTTLKCLARALRISVEELRG